MINPNKRTARIAGLLYLIVVLSGIFSLMYVPGKLIVTGDGSATVKNIIAAETLFRLGILSSFICYTAFLLLPLVLCQLLKPVHKTAAILMVVLAIVSVPISFVNMFQKLAVLTLISKAEYLQIFDMGQLQAQVLLHLDYYNNGIKVLTIFWGLWLLPFGYLVFKSGFLPKILGILLMIGCFGYLINFTGNFLFTGYRETGISRWVSLPASIAEIGTCLWLLIIGIHSKNLKTDK
ncbi:DUF4386 domain-containing protein [Pedobacter sp. KBW06]|uniref:DUF4386 domain-containing protein n=1 Tax=Pedobacter sp. KBW06 TaxID=2153359 RepID=UPI000F5B4CD0|nr:DUF4386 domain-containing protein [Pedobacter sp. KBW06]RQO69498.1 DUF4386 domain-containing protein [Pedobacter sp. KBW06]